MYDPGLYEITHCVTHRGETLGLYRSADHRVASLTFRPGGAGIVLVIHTPPRAPDKRRWGKDHWLPTWVQDGGMWSPCKVRLSGVSAVTHIDLDLMIEIFADGPWPEWLRGGQGTEWKPRGQRNNNSRQQPWRRT